MVSDTLWAVQTDRLDSEQVRMAGFEITLFTVLGLFVKKVVKMALSELAAAIAGSAGTAAIADSACTAAIAGSAGIVAIAGTAGIVAIADTAGIVAIGIKIL